MPYVSLYRKYRPQNFEDVVGQDHITRTLKNAIREGRIASGYLFCGTRGTAKTTCARILAKALNCIGPDGQRDSPTPEPCGECGPCRSIANSNFVDVIEIDAASHGKVDDVREIVAAVKFQPMEGRYKVYIVDEAHQLSRDAMDAFLKTLEEPPDRVLFVLATTDAEKLPITIASRCQVFEFKRGTVRQISARLAQVLKSEGISAEPKAVNIIARAADGSYRDSLSLLEQVLAYNRENVTVADVTMVLGTVDEEILAQVVDMVADSDAAGAFALAGQILESGKDVRQFLKSLAARFREILYVGVGADRKTGAENEVDEILRLQAARFAPPSVLNALETLTEAEREMRTNNQHRLLLEMALLRLMRLQAAPALRTATAPSARPSVQETAAPNLVLQDIDDESEDEEPAESLILVSMNSEELTQIETDTPEEEGLFDSPELITAPAPSRPTHDLSPPDHDDVVERLQRSWHEVINRVSSVRPAAVSLIKDAEATAVAGKLITLTLSNKFYVDRLTTHTDGRKMIEDQINRTLGVAEGTYNVKGVLREDAAKVGHPVERRRGASAPTAPPVSVAAEQPNLDPLMDEVIALFGGRIEEDDVKG